MKKENQMSKKEESRKYSIVIPAYKAERDFIDAEAKNLGLTRASYCRYILMGCGRKRTFIIDDPEGQDER